RNKPSRSERLSMIRASAFVRTAWRTARRSMWLAGAAALAAGGLVSAQPAAPTPPPAPGAPAPAQTPQAQPPQAQFSQGKAAAPAPVQEEAPPQEAPTPA